MTLPSAYELAMRRFERGEIGGRKEEPKRVELPGLLDDGTWSDERSRGYFPSLGGVDPASGTVVALPDETLENGIATLAFLAGGPGGFRHAKPAEFDGLIERFGPALPGYLIPVSGPELALLSDQTGLAHASDKERLEAYEELLRDRIAVRTTFPGLRRGYELRERNAGRANAYKAALELGAGECHHAAAVLAGLLRKEGIVARIAAFDEADPESWAEVCRRLGRFRAEYNRDLAQRGMLPDYVMLSVKSEDGQADRELKSILRGERRIELDPADDKLRTRYRHVWVEAKIDGAWTAHDTTRLRRDLAPDPVMDMVFEVMQPKRVLRPEYRIMRQDDKIIGRFKEPAAW